MWDPLHSTYPGGAFISGKFDSEQFIKASVEGYFTAAPYCAGTDTCANGNQCENDLAVLSMGHVGSFRGFMNTTITLSRELDLCYRNFAGVE